MSSMLPSALRRTTLPVPGEGKPGSVDNSNAYSRCDESNARPTMVVKPGDSHCLRG